MNIDKRQSRIKILIVDDEWDLVILYKNILKKFKYFVESASNGEEAVKIHKKAYENRKRFDCIIMDYRMPIKDGFEAVKEILNLDKKTKIIFASADDSIEQEVLKLGVKAFLKKPFATDVLINALRC